MGANSSKQWIPPKGFEQICKHQGFQAISPPVCYTQKTIHSIDLSNDNRIYYVERSVQPNCTIIKKQEASLETNKQSGNVVIIRKEGTDYIVLEMELIVDSGDIFVQSIEGDYTLKHSYYSLPNFPKYVRTSNTEYNRLKGLFDNDRYSIFSRLV